MALTPSQMVPLGTLAPDFELPDTITGNLMRLSELSSPTATVIMFICNHCPYVKHVQSELVRLATDYIPKGIAFIAISSNEYTKYQEDRPENMQKVALEWGFPFPYLFDATQEVAKLYDAACTADFYIFNGENKLVYRGQLDDSRPGNGKPLTGSDIRQALEALLTGKPVDDNQKPSIGCSIKWKV
jgi:peroxiredoxin